MKKIAASLVDLHPIVAQRWSPRSFEAGLSLSDEDLIGILEAARWAPSAGNGQPWRYVVGRHGDALFKQMAASMVPANKLWAENASALILVSVLKFRDDGTPRSTAPYDAGLASSLMTIEAEHRGWAVHQIGGFDHSGLSASLGLDEGLQTIVILAIGKTAPAELLPNDALREREKAERTRLPLEEIVLAGAPSMQPADIKVVA